MQMKKEGVLLVSIGILLILLGILSPSLPSLLGAQFRETAIFLPLILSIVRPIVVGIGLVMIAAGMWLQRRKG